MENVDVEFKELELEPLPSEQTPNLNRKISMEDFAAKVEVSYQTIYRYVKSGKLVPRRTLGGKPYFLLADVEAYRNHFSSEPLILDGAPIYGTAE